MARRAKQGERGGGGAVAAAPPVAAAAAPARVFTVAGATIQLHVGGALAGTFKVEQRNDHVGGSKYLTQVLMENAFKGQGLGRVLLEETVRRFGFFRIGTPPNMQFFRPHDPNGDIALTDEGDGFITKMLAAGVVTRAQVFPMDHLGAFRAMLQAAEGSSGDESDGADSKSKSTG